jgi:hypothetical protein
VAVAREHVVEVGPDDRVHVCERVGAVPARGPGREIHDNRPWRVLVDRDRERRVTTIDPIVARAAVNSIEEAVAGVDPVIPVTSADEIVSAVCVDHVVASERNDHVVFARARDQIVSFGTDDRRPFAQTRRRGVRGGTRARRKHCQGSADQHQSPPSSCLSSRPPCLAPSRRLASVPNLRRRC